MENPIKIIKHLLNWMIWRCPHFRKPPHVTNLQSESILHGPNTKKKRPGWQPGWIFSQGRSGQFSLPEMVMIQWCESSTGSAKDWQQTSLCQRGLFQTSCFNALKYHMHIKLLVPLVISGYPQAIAQCCCATLRGDSDGKDRARERGVDSSSPLRSGMSGGLSCTGTITIFHQAEIRLTMAHILCKRSSRSELKYGHLGMIPLRTMIPVRPQWGHYNLPRLRVSAHFL